jgi:hypothetical protein
MNKNTIVRVTIPMALYESVKGKVLGKIIKEGVSIDDILNGKAKAGNKSTDFKPNMLITPAGYYGDKAELKQRSGRVTKIEPEYIYYSTEDGHKYKNAPSDLYIINGNLDEAKKPIDAAKKKAIEKKKIEVKKLADKKAADLKKKKLEDAKKAEAKKMADKKAADAKAKKAK